MNSDASTSSAVSSSPERSEFLRRGVLVRVVLAGVAVTLVGGIDLRLALFAFLFLAALLGHGLGHVERRQDVADGGGEPLLVGDLVGQAREILAALLFQPRPPQVDERLCALRWFGPGQFLPHEKSKRVLDRCVRLVGDLVVIAAEVFVLEHGRQVVGDPVHGGGAESVAPRRLHRIVDGPCIRPVGRVAGMDALVVRGELQRHGIAEAPGHGDVLGRQPAGRLGQTGRAADERRLVGREVDLEIRVAGDRPHRAGDRRPERVVPRVGGFVSLRVIAGTGHNSTPYGHLTVHESKPRTQRAIDGADNPPLPAHHRGAGADRGPDAAGEHREDDRRHEPEGDEHDPQHHQLERRRAVRRIDELRQEGEEEHRRLRVQHLGDHRLTQRRAGGQANGDAAGGTLTTGQQSLDTQIDEIGGAGNFDHREEHRRSGDDRRDPHDRHRGVDEVADGDADGGRDAHSRARGACPCRGEKHGGAGNEDEAERDRDVGDKGCRVDHRRDPIVAGAVQAVAPPVGDPKPLPRRRASAE